MGPASRRPAPSVRKAVFGDHGEGQREVFRKLGEVRIGGKVLVAPAQAQAQAGTEGGLPRLRAGTVRRVHRDSTFLVEFSGNAENDPPVNPLTPQTPVVLVFCV